MVASYIPELFPNFFGDWLCEGTGNYLSNLNHFEKCNYAGSSYNFHNPTWHWGYRHFLFFIMGAVLFIIQAIDALNQEIK